ncbi:MAG: shikimate dehydrogenase [Myxococcota bacterium]
MNDGGTTAQCGIVLHPAGHTRSPAMHRAAYRALGIDADYTVYDVPPADLTAAAQKFRDEGLRQLSVSLPHKEAMLSLVDEVEPVAREIGAVNTVTRVGDRWVGTNTDWLGALQALERRGPIDAGRAVVLGAGGTARALVYGLCQRGCEVFVLNRTRSRAESLVEELGAKAAGDLAELAALAPDILVNTTTVGLNEMVSPVAAEAIPEGAVVMDAVYAPERTRFLLDAEARGAQVVEGKWMLVYQAVEQLRLWTAQRDDPPSEEDFREIVYVMAEAFG